MSDCIFCKIANKEIPSHVIAESESAVAILDIHPLAPGHTMVMPKKHWETMLDVPDEEMGGLFQLVKRVTGTLKKTLFDGPAPHLPTEEGGAGFTLGINHGTNAGQAVPHLHIHIIPRYKGDGGGTIHSIVKNPPKESIEEIKRRVLEIRN